MDGSGDDPSPSTVLQLLSLHIYLEDKLAFPPIGPYQYVSMLWHLEGNCH